MGDATSRKDLIEQVSTVIVRAFDDCRTNPRGRELRESGREASHRSDERRCCLLSGAPLHLGLAVGNASSEGRWIRVKIDRTRRVSFGARSTTLADFVFAECARLPRPPVTGSRAPGPWTPAGPTARTSFGLGRRLKWRCSSSRAETLDSTAKMPGSRPAERRLIGASLFDYLTPGPTIDSVGIIR